MNIICVNGPPSSGKDTLGKIIVDTSPVGTVAIMKFAQPLSDTVKLILNISSDEYNQLIDTNKDEPLIQYGYPNISLRQLMINVSEDLIKPSLGGDWFAKTLSDRIISYTTDEWTRQSLWNTIVITDSGFQNEFDYFKESLKHTTDVKLIRMVRPGCDFSIDSREYVQSPDLVIENSGTIKDLKQFWDNHKGSVINE